MGQDTLPNLTKTENKPCIGNNPNSPNSFHSNPNIIAARPNLLDNRLRSEFLHVNQDRPTLTKVTANVQYSNTDPSGRNATDPSIIDDFRK